MYISLHSLVYKAFEDKPKIRTNDYDMLHTTNFRAKY